MTSDGWRTRSERAKEIADEAMTPARRARSRGFDVVAYILELAAAEARKEMEDTTTKDD
jgi:hypothetical protein